MSDSKVSTGERLHGLDGVRAVAATLVVLHHIGAWNAAMKLTATGYTLAGALLFGVTAGGVELFFVLSGVVLARPFLRARRPLVATTYFSRRAKRLYPPFFVAWLLAGLSIYLASIFPTWWTVEEALPQFSIGDWLLQIGIVYWGERLYNNPMWSLSTEVMFYCVFPLLVPLFRPVAARRSLTLPALALSVAAAVLAFSFPVVSIAVFNRLFVYASCFCGGMLLAAIDFPPTWRPRIALAGVAAVVCSAYFVAFNPHIGWGLLALAVVSSASDKGTILERTLSKPLFVWLGERSYSLFLTHNIVIVLVYQCISYLTPAKGAAYFLATRLLALPLVLLAAMLLFHFVERRFAKNLVTANAFWPWDVVGRSNFAYAGAT